MNVQPVPINTIVIKRTAPFSLVQKRKKKKNNSLNNQIKNKMFILTNVQCSIKLPMPRHVHLLFQ